MYIQMEKLEENVSCASHNSIAQKKSDIRKGISLRYDSKLKMIQAKLDSRRNCIDEEVQSGKMPVIGGQVAQLEYDDSIRAGVFNMVGEKHDKSEAQRQKEKFAAAKLDLFYYTEDELFTLKDGINDQKADPNNLRILFALSRLKESINMIVLKRNKNVEKERDSIIYIIENVEGDIDEFRDGALKDSFTNLQQQIHAQKAEEALKTIDKIAFEVDPLPLGGSRGLSAARSEAMHRAASEGHNRRVMWMVGSNHTDDIDSIYGDERKYTMVKQGALDELVP